VPRLSLAEQEVFLRELNRGWSVKDDRLRRRFEHEDFKQAMVFVNALANLAESENHHPDFCVHYNRVDVTLWTHAINGLSENDFILAAKVDSL